MMFNQPEDSVPSGHRGIDHSSSAPPVAIPPGHVGPFVIPGTGRMVWWTGRVAIGLSSLWIQRLMIGRGRRSVAA
jgi:hypothetical protein